MMCYSAPMADTGNGWIDTDDIPEIYPQIRGINGKPPVAVELRNNRQEARFLFAVPTDREPFYFCRLFWGGPSVPVFVFTGDLPE